MLLYIYTCMISYYNTYYSLHKYNICIYIGLQHSGTVLQHLKFYMFYFDLEAFNEFNEPTLNVYTSSLTFSNLLGKLSYSTKLKLATILG